MARAGKRMRAISEQVDRTRVYAVDEALELLVAYRWPGNVDEVLTLVEQAFDAARGPIITAADLPKAIRVAVHANDRPPPKSEAIVLDDLMADIEVELLRRALSRAKGNKTKAAELLGISRARLHRRLEQLDLTDNDQLETMN